MTTLGKILVFLTFLAALGMGGLMVFLSRESSRWPQVVEDRNAHIAVQKSIIEQEQQSRDKWIQEAKRLEQRLDAALLEARAREEKLKAERDDYEAQRDNYKRQAAEAVLGVKQAKEESVRLQSELNFMITVVDARDKSIVKLQQAMIDANAAKQAALNTLETVLARNDALLKQLAEKEIAIEKLQRKSQPAATVIAREKINDPRFENPPPVMVEGKIQAVDGKLVKVSLGTDQGVQKDHTLLVYRTQPKLEYLGRILITDADFRFSIARLIVQPGVPAPTLMAGDEVISKLRQ
jgi:hypothetical protein